MVSPSCGKENLGLSQILKTFDVEHANYVSTWWNIILTPTITLSEEVYDLLTSEPYSTFITVPINQWAPASKKQMSSIIRVDQNQTYDRTERLQPVTSSTHDHTITTKKNALYPSDSSTISMNDENTTDADCGKDGSAASITTITHQQRLHNTTDGINTDDNDIQQENSNCGQKRNALIVTTNQTLPLLPTATNLMSTRQPPSKKKKK
ncbi:unnamed protein product [Adineta ricciae]|uniref:Uncharacterized protein n=1 Tax=Adineta ricciae TaxID=249248 RepID=A0A816GK76_ADIRI|nr:unnamed protein product [Adineta ricciae]